MVPKLRLLIFIIISWVKRIGSLYLMFENILITYLSLKDTRRIEYQILPIYGLVMVIWDPLSFGRKNKMKSKNASL